MLWVPVEARCRHGHVWQAMAPVRAWPGRPGRVIVGPLDDVRPDCPSRLFSGSERPCGAPAWAMDSASPERLERWREDLLEGGRGEQPVRHRNG